MLVIQNDVGNQYSSTVVVAIITGKPKKEALPTHYSLPAEHGLEVPSQALLEQVRTIDKSQLNRFIRKLDEETMKGIPDLADKLWTKLAALAM